jgi:hypothetical protein
LRYVVVLKGGGDTVSALQEELREELDTYARREEEFKKTASGKFVVIKGAEVVGFFDDLDAALTEGTRRFGLQSYLVRKVGEPVQTLTIPALALGLIGAHS